MGRKSTRENKSLYQLAREEQGLTLEKAGELMPGVTAERIAKLESGAARIQPEDALAMAECYKAPELLNYYCTHECAIGQKTMREVELKPFAQIAIETVNALNKLTRQKDRLLEIVADGQVRADEREDFLTIKATLDKIAATVNALQLWVDNQVAEGKLDRSFSGRERE